MIVAGRGNNGGDGFVAAAELAERGCDASVMLLCRRDTLKGDAARAAAQWHGPTLGLDPTRLGKPTLIIDALFGAGLNRPVKGDARAMIEAINQYATEQKIIPRPFKMDEIWAKGTLDLVG